MSKNTNTFALLLTLLMMACGSTEQAQNFNDGSEKGFGSDLLTTTTFNPVFDTYVDQSNPTSSYASSTVLSGDGPSGSNEKHAYLEYNVTGITGTISSVTLRITVGSGSAASADQYVIKKIGTAGSASRILTGTYTWNAKPTEGATIANKTGFAASATADFTIPASNITGNGYYAFAIVNGSGSDGLDFSSMEGASKPQLIINTTPVSGGTCTNNIYSAGSKYLPRNMWVWNDSIDTINNSTNRTNLINFAESRNVTTLYINVRDMLENYSSSQTTRTNFATLLNAAAAKCIDVQMLVGNGGSYLSDSEKSGNYPKMVAIAQNAKSYTAGLTGTKPTALHWDLEPQQLGTTWDNNKKEYVQRAVNAFQRVRAILAGSGLKQAEDIPHWWDDPADYSAVKCDPNDNRTNPQFSLVGFQCLVKVLDQIDLMDYRDRANLTISQANDEMNYTNSNLNFNGNRTAIVVGQETGSTTLDLTFYDELRGSSGNRCQNGFTGTKCMEYQLQIIQHNYNATLAYPGIALESVYSASNPSNSFYLRPAPGVPAGISMHHYEKYNSSSIILNF